MIYTGYFAKLKEYENNGLIPISISGKAPDFYNGIEYKRFAPSWSIYNNYKNGNIDEFGYTERYKKEILDKLNPVEIKQFLTSFDKDIILLCYEKQGDFCHRHLVADWIESNLGKSVEEYECK